MPPEVAEAANNPDKATARIYLFIIHLVELLVSLTVLVQLMFP